MKITDTYVEQALSNGVTVNIKKEEIKERLRSIENYVNETFLSLDVIKLLTRDNIETMDIAFLGMLVGTICVPNPVRKLRLSAITDALKMATHSSFAKCSKSEYDDLLNHISEEIIDYSVLTGNENKYSTGEKLGISVAKKLAGKICRPIIKPFTAPANILKIKWILAGIHQALVRYLINLYIFDRGHGIAVSEACKGYEDVLSKRFKDKLEYIMATMD